MLTFLMVGNLYSVYIKQKIAEKSRLQKLTIGYTQLKFGRDAILRVAKPVPTRPHLFFCCVQQKCQKWYFGITVRTENLNLIHINGPGTNIGWAIPGYTFLLAYQTKFLSCKSSFGVLFLFTH